MAQAIADAGMMLGKNYDPYLIFFVPAYSLSCNAANVDTIFDRKRLNTRVSVKPIEKNKGEFSIYFLPLKINPTVAAPQGFNGGHIHHPISDTSQQGLGLTSFNATDDALAPSCGVAPAHLPK